jgi:hypothetical protein
MTNHLIHHSNYFRWKEWILLTFESLFIHCSIFPNRTIHMFFALFNRYNNLLLLSNYIDEIYTSISIVNEISSIHNLGFVYRSLKIRFKFSYWWNILLIQVIDHKSVDYHHIFATILNLIDLSNKSTILFLMVIN